MPLNTSLLVHHQDNEGHCRVSSAIISQVSHMVYTNLLPNLYAVEDKAYGMCYAATVYSK
jgi:hypothetical protein